MGLINEAGIALTAVFLVFLVAVVAEILYVLLRRRSLPSLRSTPSWKQLIRPFCRRGAQVEPDAGANTFPADQDDDDEVLKWSRGLLMNSPSRVLFTIKEEEKEEELVEDVVSHQHQPVNNFPLQRVQSDVVMVEVGGDEMGDPTPFSTPCASSPFYTPSPSPSRDLDDAV